MPDRKNQAEESISVWEDLRQRNVYRVGVGYAALAWLTIEVSETILPRLGLPDWSVTMVIVVAIYKIGMYTMGIVSGYHHGLVR